VSEIRELPRRAVSVGEEMAAKLEAMAARARAGEITSLALVVVRPAHRIGTFWINDPAEGNSHELVAGCSYLLHRLCESNGESSSEGWIE